MIDERAREAAAGSLQFRMAEIVTYDEENGGSVTVKYLPSGLVSGDMPLATSWAGTPGEAASGAGGGPEPGTLFLVLGLDANFDLAVALMALWSSKNLAPAVPAGEYWVFHKSGSYVKLDNEERVRIHAPVQVDLIAPLVQLTDSLDALTAEKAVVRKEDLQTLIDWINNSLIPWTKAHTHIGNLGFPTSNPITAALLLDKSAATASTVCSASSTA